ncbi:MAG: hypothetical protein RMK94_12985 [Armatimonadota bacterium]|nr:hypothetical protein [Armatimonadota bacterium]
MRQQLIGLTVTLITDTLVTIWFWWFSVPSDILEVRTRTCLLGGKYAL